MICMGFSKEAGWKPGRMVPLLMTIDGNRGRVRVGMKKGATGHHELWRFRARLE